MSRHAKCTQQVDRVRKRAEPLFASLLLFAVKSETSLKVEGAKQTIALLVVALNCEPNTKDAASAV